MKRIFLVLVSLLVATACFAQLQGDKYLGGTIGMNVGGSNLSVKASGESSSSGTPFLNSFNVSPVFGYFVIDHLLVNGSLNYSIQGLNTFDDDDDPSRTGNHQFTVGIGSHYYLPIADHFYYTPGLSLGFGFQDSYQKYQDARTDNYFFLFTLSLHLGSFEVQMSQNWALDFHLLSFCYKNASKSDETLFDQKVKLKMGSYSFTTGTIGVKYYF